MSAGVVARAGALDAGAAHRKQAECAHCALPLGRRPVAASIDGERLRFCCYGCSLAMQVTRGRGDGGAASALLVRLGLAVFFAMNVMTVSLPTWAPHVYGGNDWTAEGTLFRVLRLLALAFTAPVLILLGGPILASAVRSLRSGGAGMDALIVLASIAAFVLSVANLLAGAGAVYFDTVAMLLVFVTAGRYLEARAKAEASASVRAALAPAPERAERLVGAGSESVPLARLRAGDLVRVAPGGAFPTDGEVVDGTGDVDESALTGRSVPAAKGPGARIAGGTCSVDGMFTVLVTARVDQSAAARIAHLLHEAALEPTAAQRIADRGALILLPAVAFLALATCLFWTWRGGLEAGLVSGLSVLVVACPCGLGLATPIASWTTLAAAARRGIVVRSGAVLERIASLEQFFFDKTGTLTLAMPRLEAVEPMPGVESSTEHLLARAAALEEHVAHPLARAVVTAAHAGGLTWPPSRALGAVPGRGVVGVIDGAPLALGSARFAREKGFAIAGTGDGELSTLYLWSPDRILARFRFREVVRPEARRALDALRRLGLGIAVLSGDDGVSAVAPDLVPAVDAFAGLLPEEKVARVRAAGRNVAFAGDGINDAPAVAAADVGIAIGNATDLTRINADVAVISDDLEDVAWLVAAARRTARVIRQNLAWVVVYNIGALAMAACGRLDPLIAALAMLGSSLLVVANSRRLGGEPAAPYGRLDNPTVAA